MDVTMETTLFALFGIICKAKFDKTKDSKGSHFRDKILILNCHKKELGIRSCKKGEGGNIFSKEIIKY